jgi:pimeloyl-ACP methyl ester carboxylesterase
MIRHAILLLASVAFRPSALPGQARPSGPPPGTLVDVGGYRLHILCSGPAVLGAPSVILDAGAGAFSTAWSAVQQSLPAVRSCAYDRAGWGWSDPGPGPRTITQEAFELERLLRAAHVSGPYVLVGHSYGGLLVRRYAALHPNDVIGLVLVDPALEDAQLFYVKRNAWLRVRDQSEGRVVPHPRSLARGDTTMSYYEPGRDYWSEEFQAFHDARVANPRMFGDRPLVVLAAGKEPPPPGVSPEIWAQLRAERLEQLTELTTLSSQARLVPDPTSGHDIPKDDPQLIARCITEVVKAATGVRTTDLAVRCVAARSAP